MTKIKTRDLEGAALDWAVAEASKLDFFIEKGAILAYQAGADIPGVPYYDRIFWMPSTNWSQGGPIIEREKILISPALHGTWRASQPYSAEHYNHLHGKKPLIVAMRCYVLSKLDEEVDVPDELIGEKP